MVIQFFQILLSFLLTSLFFFPFELVALPGINTKMAMSVAGLVLAAYELVRRKNRSISVEWLVLILCAISVSAASFLAITVNQTPDTTYVSYVVSFAVWLSAAFVVVWSIRSAHGRVDVELVLRYLTAVCLVQCISAVLIDGHPAWARWVNATMDFGQDIAVKVKRLYGLGSTLDIAGVRFAAVLTGIGCLLSGLGTRISGKKELFYIVSFIVITVLGNMIARTTTVGTGIGLAVILLSLFSSKQTQQEKASSMASWLVILAIAVTACIILYNTDFRFQKLIRFAFEGFFSLAEKGTWEVGSNEKLKTMIVWPETLHTWIIGDGYFINSRYDPNYLGDATDMGYYMGTDVGYLRFLFYFGLTGLLPMTGVIVSSAVICARHFGEDAPLFYLVLLAGLVIWLKVSTDLFCFFALFLCTTFYDSQSIRHHPLLQGGTLHRAVR